MPDLNVNLNALGPLRSIQQAAKLAGSAMQKLSSGLAVNVAADAPAQLVISEMLRSQIGGIAQSMRNAQEAFNVAGIAEGGAGQVSDLLSGARELAVRAANTGANSTAQVAAMQTELDNTLASIERLAGSTRFAGEPLLNGATPTRTFQIGPDAGAGSQATLALPDVRTAQLGTAGGGPALSTLQSGGPNDLATNPGQALAVIDQAIGEVATQRGVVGAFQKDTLQTTIANMSVALENVTAMESNIRDLDFAQGVVDQIGGQNLLQASIFGLRNANFSQQQMLRLLG